MKLRTASHGHHRRGRLRSVLATAVLVAAAALAGLAGATSATAAQTTVVSLTFDDGYTDQLVAADIMDDHGMKGTFYVSSGLVSPETGPGDPVPAYMTAPQLIGLQARGHEVGGHTATHANLTQLDADEAARQVCNDRAALTDLGLRVTSFAYPYAAVDAQAEQVVEGCGYNSARGLGDIRSPEVPGVDYTCAGCPVTESIPPANPFVTAAPNQVENTWTLASLQETVTRAETTGGWLQLTFHRVDNTGGTISIAPELFEQFTQWLSERESRGTVVRTVDEVVGGTVQPLTPAPEPETRPETGNLLVNPGLEEAGPDGVNPRCWQAGGWGQNSPTFAREGHARTGEAAAAIVMSGYVDGDAKLLPMMDLGACSPTVRPGETYELSGWYQSSRATQFEVYTRNAAGGWSYWTSSPSFPASSSWSKASLRTPEIPAGATALSFGLNIAGDGRLATDDYAMYHSDHVPAEEPRTGNLIVNPGVEETNGTLPTCWQRAGWGTNESTVDVTAPGRTGNAVRLDMTSYTDGDAKLVSTLDAGTCAPPVAVGKSYDLGAWYQSTGITQFEVYRRTQGGEWVYWTSSSYFGAASEWSEAGFTTPAVPAGTTHLSFGLNVMGPGTLLTDDYLMYDSEETAPR